MNKPGAEHCYFYRLVQPRPEWEKGQVQAYMMVHNVVSAIISVDYDASVIHLPIEQVSLSDTEPAEIAAHNAKVKADEEAKVQAELEAKEAKEAKAAAKEASHPHGHK